MNVLVRGDCLDEEYQPKADIECDDVEITIVVFIATIFIIELAWMVYLGLTASRFLKEYEKAHAEEMSNK